ncbi:MAG TPA: prolyl oligopeptidase family serine peptidase [Rhodanobacteraceae bacterium]|jgi:dienelactone hydrolase|nr:prolyl oligopeptidase family serine peptidase [Rhodanobacteraceae bacterium]
MQRTFSRGLAGALLAATLGLHPAHASAPIPIEDLARLPALQSVTMSPDGEHLVGLIPSPDNKDQTALAVWDTDSLPAPPRVVTPSGGEGKMQFIAAFALKADKILAIARQEWTGQLGGCGEGKVTGATRTFVAKAYLTGLDQKKFDEAFASDKRDLGISRNTRICLELAGTASLVDMLPMDPDKVIIRRSGALSLDSGYYLYNLKTGDAELLFRGGSRTAPALFDPRTGKLLVKSEITNVGDDYEQRFLILDPKTGQFEPQPALTTRLSNRHEVSVVGIDDASGKYYVLTDQFSDQVQARFYDATTQKYDADPVVADRNHSIVGLVFGNQAIDFNKVVGFVVGGPYLQTIYVDPTLKAIQAGLEKSFPGRQIGISSYSNDFSRVLFTTESASEPEAFHMLFDKQRVVNLGSERPWIKPGMTGKESWVTYQARDGMKIPAILDLPAGWQEGDAPAPAIVMPHGGPWARDFMGWDPTGWVPMLTSRGYAVLRPQYRGSAGLGHRLWLAGDKQWGKKMSDDIDDGAAWLVAQHIADKDRIAIFGYSYGGFAAVAADVRSPSPYQCAIAGAPVADLGRLGTSWSDNRVQRIIQGWTVRGMDPMQNIDKAHLPILIYDGDRDVRTPRRIHAIPFFDAVKGKVPAQYHEIPDMPHSLPWYPSQQRTTLNMIMDYLETDCGPGGL